MDFPYSFKLFFGYFFSCWRMKMQQARIKLTGTDPEKLAYVCDQLKKIA